MLFLAYSRYQDPASLTPDAIGAIQRIAHIFYLAMAASLGAVALGLHRWRATLAASGSGYLGALAAATDGAAQRRAFAATLAAYGVFFTLFSGTLVYQPGIDFEEHYGAEIPSAFVSPCCGPPGYMPKILVYLEWNVGLQVVPLNLVLQLAVSYLVALNVSLAVRIRRLGGGAGAGAAAGLFVACPACAGAAASIFAGTAGGIAVSAALAPLQTAFIAVSIPVLLAGPLVAARKLRGAC
ncbi:MAG: hypothetical protein MPI95_00035 [Nitrosopumilus sp.]|nr:hypothetical protein [Nitrosopumilus sp.]CAI9831391.1 conserved membrane hypothetical protein [Nitrosopumilaceae archaeon]MDA7944236.1 hypothetical protein [Nitrosopumilus sp.]MDA7952330.1 hypothetical protein [Nitrosopumilus sp.]MDA7953988.1 hypothetical protein [Nitrosopumilus sp.]